MRPTPPSYDLELATQLRLRFTVVTKAAIRRAWVRHGELASLAEACAAVESLDAFEVGSFLVHRDNNGSVYWTTRAPDVYNTTVLEHARLP